MFRRRPPEHRRLGIRYVKLPDGRKIAVRPDPCAVPGHSCVLCEAAKRYDALTRAERADADAEQRTRSAAQRAEIARRRALVGQPPLYAATTRVDW